MKDLDYSGRCVCFPTFLNDRKDLGTIQFPQPMCESCAENFKEWLVERNIFMENEPKQEVGMWKLEMLKNRRGKFFLRLKSGNGMILMHSESYSQMSAAKRSAQSIMKHLRLAKFVEVREIWEY